MTHLRIAQLLGLLMVGISAETVAYEEEDSIPLTIFSQGNSRHIKKTFVTLNGRDVEIKSEIHNDDKNSKRIGFVAYTPFFEQLGDGEEHLDKTFSDLTVALNAKSVKPIASRRGFFLGKDISLTLSKAGIDPLPDSNVDEKKLAHVPNQFGMPIRNWQGLVTYSWIADLQPNSTNWQTVRYRALPRFERDEISSERFRQRVLQHCGNPEVVRKYLMEMNGGSNELLVERYELPVQFMKMDDLQFEVVQPTKNWLGAHPLISLICGINEIVNKRLNYSGVITNTEKSISVLVISKLNDLSEK
jgi:hypothetical protein